MTCISIIHLFENYHSSFYIFESMVERPEGLGERERVAGGFMTSDKTRVPCLTCGRKQSTGAGKNIKSLAAAGRARARATASEEKRA